MDSLLVTKKIYTIIPSLVEKIWRANITAGGIRQWIREISQNMLKDMEGTKRSDHVPFRPETSTFLILDMQRYFLNETSHGFVNPILSEDLLNVMETGA